VDDDPAVRDGTALVLQQAGWLTAAAATPDAAIQEMAAMQARGEMPEGDMPAALISDHRLGLTIDGLDALRALRYEFGEGLPAFLITGDTSSALAARAQAEGVTVLAKPVQVARLTEALAHIRHDGGHEQRDFSSVSTDA